MTSQFTPSDRSEVVEKLKDSGHIHDASPAGEGVQALRNGRDSGPHNQTALVENFGWYLASYEKRDDGDSLLYMPITEVSTDDD